MKALTGIALAAAISAASSSWMAPSRRLRAAEPAGGTAPLELDVSRHGQGGLKANTQPRPDTPRGPQQMLTISNLGSKHMRHQNVPVIPPPQGGASDEATVSTRITGLHRLAWTPTCPPFHCASAQDPLHCRRSF